MATGPASVNDWTTVEPSDWQDVPAEKPSLTGFAHNVVDSGAKFAGSVAHAVAHPIDTGAALVKTAAGGVNEAAKASGLPGVNGVDESHFNALKDTYGDRYGSVGKALHTAYSDPVGFAADLATVVDGGGVALRAAKVGADAAGLARTAGALDTVANAASTARKAVDPVSLAGKVVDLTKGPIDSARDAVASKIYGSALKPVPSASPVERAEIVDAGLRNKIPLTHSGSAKLKSKIDAATDAVSQRVAQGGQAGDAIDSQAVADSTDRSLNQVGGVNPVSDRNAIHAAKNEFLDEYSGRQPAVPPQPTGLLDAHGNPIMGAGAPAVPPQPIPVDKALDIAKKTKPKAYGELSGAANEAQKDMRRNIKQQIYQMYPELQDIGNQQRIDINLDEAVDRFLSREGNKTVMSMAGPITGLASEAIAPGSGFVIGAAKHVIDKTPGLASKIAIAVAKKAPAGPITLGANKLRQAATPFATPAERLSSPTSSGFQIPTMPSAQNKQSEQPQLGAQMAPPVYDPYGIR